MNFDEYVAARYGRLFEHAVLLGCAEDEAEAYVDRVLLEQRKRIGRADDPDPLVHEALERAIAGEPEPRPRIGPFVAVGVVAVALGVGVWLTYSPSPERLPPLFGLDGHQAETLLESRGYDVVLLPTLACEPEGLVLGSDPPVGRLVDHGATVTVRIAAPSDNLCETGPTARSDAWAFVAFALGGPAPEFARTVRVVVDGSDPTTLAHDAATQVARWGGLMTLVVSAAHQTAPTSTGMPRLVVTYGPPPEVSCGIPRPVQAGERPVLRLQIDTRRLNDHTGCALTIDLYRDSRRVIDAVVVYSAKD